MNETAFNNVKFAIHSRLVDDVLPTMGATLEGELLDILTEKIYWAAFEGRTTVRQNPNAAQPVAVGAYRDSRDTDEVYDSADYEVDDAGLTNALLGVFVEVDDADGFYEERPLYDVLLGRVSILRLFEEAWDATV
jgi:hypothetical protein